MKPNDSCKSFRKTTTTKGRQGRKRYKKSPTKSNIFKSTENEDKQKQQMRMYICEPLQDAKPLFFPSEDATFDNGKKALDDTRENHENRVYTYLWRFIRIL